MKKTILVTLVAAMMIFAFTACDNSGYQLPANVEYIAVEQTGDFVYGQNPDAAKFDVYAYDTNGGKSIVPGAVVIFSEAGSSGSSAVTEFESGKTYIASATLKVSSSNNSDLEGSTIVKVYAIESVEISGAPELAVYSAPEAVSKTAVVKADGTASSVADYTNAKYEVVYNGNSKMEFSAEDLMSLIGFEAFVTKDVTAIVTGTEYAVYIRTSSDSYIPTNLTATGVDKKPEVVVPPSVQTGLTSTVSEKNYIGENTDVKIFATYSDKDPVQITDLQKYVIVETSNGNKVVTSIPTTFDTASHSYRVTDPTNSWSTTVEIPAGQNYYLGDESNVTVAPAALSGGATYKYGQEISGNDVTVTIATKNTDKADGSQTDLKYPVADSIISVELVGVDHIPSKEALSGASFTANCLVTFTSMGETKSVTKSVTFNNISE